MYLFVAQDAGPANYLANVASALDGEAAFLASPISESLFRERGVSPFVPALQPAIEAVITGTCSGPGIDKEYLIKAKEWGIPSIAVVEHWSWYRERFLLDNGLLLPDYILVNDQHALEDAVEAGLPTARLKVIGNPVLEQLISKAITIPKADEVKQKYGFAPDERVCVFASEELQRDFPPDSPSYQGFDEFIVLEHLTEFTIRNGLSLAVKLHPAEQPDKYRESERVHGFRVFGTMPKQDIFALSDLMVGMGSMLLIEAALAGVKHVIAYRPGERMPFFGSRIGACPSARNLSELEYAFSAYSSSKADEAFSDSFLGSTQRFISFIHQISR
jgi:hypothetical protein